MLSRPHQRHGWLYLQPGDWRACLDRLITERDQLDDPSDSGPPPAWIHWVDCEQMPHLAKHPHYTLQFNNRISELQFNLQQINTRVESGRLDMKPEADQIRDEINWLTEMLS